MQTHTIEPLFYTVAQAQRLLGIQRTKFYGEVAAGRIHIVKNGTRTFVHRDEIQRYVDLLLGR
jgi:excisionase family DNA binding protein